MRSWWGRAVGLPDREVADTAQSLLDGTLPERAGGRARRLPPWAWISALVHGDRHGLEQLACRQGDRDAAASWAQAVGFLAGEVLDLAGGQDERLVDLQRRILVPVELDLLDQAARGWTPGPQHVVSTVLADLDEERRARPAR